MLTLCEELLLLAIDDETGKVTPSALETLQFGLVGGILAELAIQHKIEIENEKLNLKDETPTGDQNLDEVLHTIAIESKSRKITHWINTLGKMTLITAYANRLVEKGIIKVERKRYLWVIPYEVYPQQDAAQYASAKYWVKLNLRSMVMAGGKPEADLVVLLSLLKACRLLKLVFTKDERKAAEKKIGELVEGNDFGDAVAHTVDDIEVAAMIVVMASIGA